MKTYFFIKSLFRHYYGLSINNLHNGKGFTLYLGPFLVWHQAWFGKHNQVSWWHGKFYLSSSLIGWKYAPKIGFLHMKNKHFKF